MNYINPQMLVQSYKNQESLNNFFKNRQCQDPISNIDQEIKNKISTDVYPKVVNPKSEYVEGARKTLNPIVEGYDFREHVHNLESIFNDPSVLKLIIFVLLFVVLFMFFQLKSVKLEQKILELKCCKALV
jgi:hypothetical protein